MKLDDRRKQPTDDLSCLSLGSGFIALEAITVAGSYLTMTAPGVLRFSAFDVTRQVFYQSKLSFAIVNLKPIVDNRPYQLGNALHMTEH